MEFIAEKGFYGIRDHSLGNELSILAIARGASLVERHLTLDKSDDHILSLTTDEFISLVTTGRGVSRTLNSINH